MKIIDSYRHCEPFAFCHSEPFAPCHSERSEESRHEAQDKLREAIPSYRLLRRYAPHNDNGK